MNKNRAIVISLLLFCIVSSASALSSLSSLNNMPNLRDIPVVTPYGEMVHSSVDPDGNLRFFWQDLSYGLVPNELFYRTNDGYWNLASEGDINNASALVPYQFGDILRYRLSTKVSLPDPVGEVSYIQAAYLDSSPSRPDLSSMAKVADDPVGDSLMVYQPYYDLTSLQMAVSGDRLYSCLSNASNTFPTMNTLSSYNIYGVLLGNESITNGSVYAMIYTFSVPGVISPGLYRIEIEFDMETMPTFERVGDVVSEVYGGKLYLSCNIDDLAASVGEGAWPSEGSNLLFMGAASLSLTVSFSTFEPEFGIGDLLNGGLIEFTDNSYHCYANQLPVLSNAQNYDHELSLHYFDGNGDYPLVMEYVFADGSREAMEAGDTQGGNRTFSLHSANNFAGGYVNCSDNLIDYVIMEFDEVSVDDEHVPAAQMQIIAPNPMRGGAMYKIEVKTEDTGITELYLYDLRGRKLGKLFNGYAQNGGVSFDWDCSMEGKMLSSGVYFIKAEVGGKSSLRRLIILK